jgi:hypothetical protein
MVLGAQQLADLVVSEVVGDAVAAHHEPVPGDRVDDGQVGFHVLAAVQRADQHRTMRVDACFGRVIRPRRRGLDERVVARDLLQLPVA